MQRLREHLTVDARHAEDRHRELAALRAELAAKDTLITHLRTQLAHTDAPTDAVAVAVCDTEPTARLSRQQRRAAQRGRHKNP